ncbi:DUF5916 domain-containing protein [Hymenobacter siberiensis]|uniref:DUF5916 domain-containing protein n=1 Tax=Hymenobacter siberiensis TaxID=2848396 RepID=UPI001C1E88EE|nr:DUF5916 domain-containing protein [Hymenobacter siberiensis]MBU6123088.1 hypothetical protein [Hymenobacter siberiensis]
MRQRKRDNAVYFWNEVKPQVDGFVNQWGELTGVQGVKPPLRLSLTPYVSGYVNHNPLSADGTKRLTTRFNGGADVKWGINESFTLDATLVPDFGQVQSDNQVLNLSPFEVQFNVDWSLRQNQIDYVNGGLDKAEPLDQPFAGQILLGRRNVATVAYTFTNRMSFTLRLRHYTSNVRYLDFTTLGKNAEEQSAAYQLNRDNTYNAFNVDAVYSWWFAPGSQISVVWKNAGSTYLQANEATPQFFDNFNNTINTPHNNSLSVKVLYYLDYLALRKGSGRVAAR